MAAKIITIAQQKGGAGKTTLAAQLGVAFSAAGKKRGAGGYRPAGEPRRMAPRPRGNAGGRFQAGRLGAGGRLSRRQRADAPQAEQRHRHHRQPAARRNRGQGRGPRRRSGADPRSAQPHGHLGHRRHHGPGANVPGSDPPRPQPGAAARQGHRRDARATGQGQTPGGPRGARQPGRLHRQHAGGPIGGGNGAARRRLGGNPQPRRRDRSQASVIPT